MAIKEIYIDTETTALDPMKAGMLQLSGAIRIDGKIKEFFNFTCKPFEGSVIEQEALDVNGITIEQIKQFEDPNDSYRKFTKILEKYVNKMDKTDKFLFKAYSARYDVDVLRQWFLKNDDKFFGSWFWHPELCVLQRAAWNLKEKRVLLPNFKLVTVAKYFGVNVDESKLHDAKYDIAVTIALDDKLDALEKSRA